MSLGDERTFSSLVNAQHRKEDLQSAIATSNVAPTIEALTYSVSQTAALLGISKASVYRLLNRRLLKSVRGLRNKRIPRRQVNELSNGETRHE